MAGKTTSRLLIAALVTVLLASGCDSSSASSTHSANDPISLPGTDYGYDQVAVAPRTRRIYAEATPKYVGQIAGEVQVDADTGRTVHALGVSPGPRTSIGPLYGVTAGGGLVGGQRGTSLSLWRPDGTFRTLMTGLDPAFNPVLVDPDHDLVVLLKPSDGESKDVTVVRHLSDPRHRGWWLPPGASPQALSPDGTYKVTDEAGGKIEVRRTADGVVIPPHDRMAWATLAGDVVFESATSYLIAVPSAATKPAPEQEFGEVLVRCRIGGRCERADPSGHCVSLRFHTRF